ncbi:MAG: 6-phosphofructokinase, partial [Campylobacterota bacterium]
MSIAVLCSGGDCAGMNPAVKKFVDYSYDLGLEPYLVFDGLEGLIDNNIKKASHEDVAGIIHEGGTIIRSSRSKRFFEKSYRDQAYQNLKDKGITKLVVLGGDGSFRALDIFSKDYNLSFIGIPSTIDNDIFGTEYCLGVDTALNVIRRATDELRDTSAS